MPIGQLIIITGPSGVGKGTLVRALLARHQDLHLSVSATTRPPRPGEIDGKDYYFMTKDQFEALIQAGEFLEWAEYAGNYYGTPRSKVEEQIQQGKTVILEIEVVGARAVKRSVPTVLRVFILPPSVAELERRLRSRGQDAEVAIARRLERAQAEIAESHQFDRQIVNDDLETALQQLEAVIYGRD